MKYVALLLIGYVVMYLAIWLHEIGHSIFDYKYGAKSSWIKVNVKPYIFFSTPGDIDADVWSSLKPGQRIMVAYAGIGANFIWAVISGCIAAWVSTENIYVLFGMWLFLTLHIGEIFSYLFIGSIYIVSDMAIIADNKPSLRIPNIILGLVFTIIYIAVLYVIPASVQLYIVIWNIITVASMCLGRIIFTIKSK